MVLERLLWCITCLNHASFHLFTAARSSSCGPTRKLILLGTQSLVVLQVGDVEKSPQSLGFESLDPLFRVSKQGPCITATEDGDDEACTA